MKKYGFACLLLLALIVPQTAQAQAFSLIQGLFNSVNSLNFYVHAGDLVASDNLTAECRLIGLCGMGAEVLLNLPAPEGLSLELALGTNFLQGFEASDPTIDLRGSLRSLPELSVYATKENLLKSHVISPYVGLHFGLSEFWNARAYDAEGREYKLKGETFDYGITGGLFFEGGFFVELAYRQRNFASLDWSLPDGVLPAGWPRALNLSGWLVAVGWQFSIGEDE